MADDTPDQLASLRRKRPPAPTIDLTATEVPTERPAEKTAAAETPKAAEQPAAPEPPKASAEEERVRAAAAALKVAAAPEKANEPAAEPAKASPEKVAPEKAAPEPTPERSAAGKRTDEPPPRRASRPTSPPLPPRTSSWQPVAGGILGAVLAVGGLVALWALGYGPMAQSINPQVAARLNALDQKVVELTTRVGTAVDQKALGDVNARIGVIEQAMGRLRDFDTRLTRIEANGAAGQATQDTGFAERLVTLEGAAKAITAAMADLRQRVEAATAAADAAQKAVAKPANELEMLAGRIATLEKLAKTLETEVTKAYPANAPDRAARFAFAASALRAAVERGPFVAELAAAKPFITDTAALARLEAVAPTGVASIAALTREFSEASPAMLRAAAPEANEAGVLDKLQASAFKLVRVRPAVDSSGDDAPAVIGRIESKTAQGDVGGALAEFAKLPAPVRAAAEAWYRKAETRHAVTETARRLAADSLASLAKP